MGLRGDILGYGEALISVAAGARRHGGTLPSMAPAFAEEHVPLDHRIETVTTQRRPVGGLLRVALASVAVLVVGAACEMPPPTATEEAVEVVSTPPTDVAEESKPAIFGPNEIETVSPETETAIFGPNEIETVSPETEAARADEPVLGPVDTGQFTAVDDAPDAEIRFIPYDTPPALANSREVQRLLEETYPPLLKESGIGGEVIVWLYISEDGEVLQSQVREDPPGTSGYEPLDAAALEVADAMVFEPAMNRDERTAVWVQIPITFTVGR
ncbi:MAG TPA: TonB family protein [Longimicrobiales bacterium]|nr:TonB family protein [Longimicrobiales bacterium]